MRARCVIRTVGVCYALLCIMLAVFLGELAFRPLRMPLRDRHSAQSVAARFGAALQDVSLSARGGIQLRGWFASPANANGDAVILLHGVGDNREGMGGLTEFFLAKGFAVLLPDSRAQGESGGKFHTYGVKETACVMLRRIGRESSDCHRLRAILFRVRVTKDCPNIAVRHHSLPSASHWPTSA
jgi:hypothetical protein